MINISKFVDVKSLKLDITFIYIHRDEKNLYTVATDSYRMARIAYPLDTDLYTGIADGFYTPKYFTELCKSLLKKKATVTDKQMAINSFNATKSTGNYTYPDYTQLIKQYEEDKRTDKVMHGIIGKYNAKYLSEFIDLSSELKDFNSNGSKYTLNDIDATADFNSRERKPLIYQKDDSYILLMPLNR